MARGRRYESQERRSVQHDQSSLTGSVNRSCRRQLSVPERANCSRHQHGGPVLFKGKGISGIPIPLDWSKSGYNWPKSGLPEIPVGRPKPVLSSQSQPDLTRATTTSTSKSASILISTQLALSPSYNLLVYHHFSHSHGLHATFRRCPCTNSVWCPEVLLI